MTTKKTITNTAQRNFMKGVSWACAFLRRADALNGGNTEHAQAMFRAGAQQAQLVPEMLATLATHPELVAGANAILTAHFCSAGPSGAGMMNIGAYSAMTLDDFMREDAPDEFQGTDAVAAIEEHTAGVLPADQIAISSSNGTPISERGILVGLQASWELDALLELALGLNAGLGSMEQHEVSVIEYQLRCLLLRMQQLGSVTMGVMSGEAEIDVSHFEFKVHGRELVEA